MTFETFYNIGDTIYRSTSTGEVIKRKITSIKILHGKDGTQISYGVDTNNGFREDDVGRLIHPTYDLAKTMAKLLEAKAIERTRYLKELELEKARQLLKDNNQL